MRPFRSVFFFLILIFSGYASAESVSPVILVYGGNVPAKHAYAVHARDILTRMQIPFVEIAEGDLDPEKFPDCFSPVIFSDYLVYQHLSSEKRKLLLNRCYDNRSGILFLYVDSATSEIDENLFTTTDHGSVKELSVDSPFSRITPCCAHGYSTKGYFPHGEGDSKAFIPAVTLC